MVDAALEEAQKRLEKRKEALKKGNLPPSEPPENPEPEEETLKPAPAVEKDQQEAPPIPEAEPERPAPTPVEAEPEPTEDDPRDAKIAELTQKLNTADGRFGGELDKLKKQIEETSDRLTRAQQENLLLLNKLQEKSDPPPPKPTEEDEYNAVFKGIPKELLDGYDDEALKVIVGVAKNVATAQREQVAHEAIEPLEKRLAELREQSTQSSFMSTVELLAPGFVAANGSSSRGVPPNESWVTFLDTPVNPKISQETWRELATRLGTPEATANVFKQWQASGGETEGGDGVVEPEPVSVARPSVKEQVAPVTSSASSPQAKKASDGKPKRLSRKGYNQLLVDMSAPDGFTDENRKLLREYQLAEMEGRLV